VYTDEPTFRVFVHDLGRGVLNPLTVDVRADWPVWTPDGERLLFNRFTPGEQDVYWARADNAEVPEPYWRANSGQQHPQDFSPDGRYLVYQERAIPAGPDSDLWVYDLESGQARTVVDGTGIEKQGDISPDGRWLAFASDISGRDEVYVTEFPESRSRTKISIDGAHSPVWSPQGDELFYMRGDRTIMSVEVTLGEAFSASAPTELLAGNLHRGYPYGRAFDVSHDGRRFLVGDLTVESSGVGRIEVIENWLAEVRRRLDG
jgi:Tol biopolymer transport system component